MITAADILNARVLVVAEQEADARVLERMLAGAGYGRLACTSSPQEVCARQRKAHYDLILFDLPVPGTHEFQAMKALQALDETDVPAVLSITAQPDQRLRALQAGARDFVSKPFEPVELLTRVGNVLEARLLSFETKNHGKALERFVQDLQEQALTDPLTDLLNRRFLQEFLPREAAKAQRNATPLAVIMIDLDFFKRVNDACGHEAGDLVLRKVAGLLKESCRASDIACRLGGDEFSLILPRATLDGARRKAEDIRTAIMALELTQRKQPLGAISASLGVAVSPDHGADAESLLRAADVALYAAKASGRNRVVVAAACNIPQREFAAGSSPGAALRRDSSTRHTTV